MRRSTSISIPISLRLETLPRHFYLASQSRDCHIISRSDNLTRLDDDGNRGTYLAAHKVGVTRGSCNLQSQSMMRQLGYDQGTMGILGDMNSLML